MDRDYTPPLRKQRVIAERNLEIIAGEPAES